MINLNDLTFDELEREISAIGEPKFRAGQIFKWFSRGVFDFSQMSDLSATLREKLSRDYTLAGADIKEKFSSKIDGTVKYLLGLNDGNVIESVAMSYKHGISVCISTQVGCAMGCGFCASTIGGRARNLTSGEILAQVSVVQKDFGERVSNIVLMGIGEPLDNFDNVIRFLKNINHPKGMNIGYRHISLSTCGVVDKIYELAKENLPITLSVSLHAPDNETRGKIMPINKKYPIEELIEACNFYLKATGRRITFEYILIDGVNDSPRHADKLARLIGGMLCHVNLIPANFVPESGLSKSDRKTVLAFRERLEQRKINVTIRRELGSDIEASCGQLRQKAQRAGEQ